MTNLKVLESYGCTKDRIRELFTCEDEKCKDSKVRKDWEERIQARVNTGIRLSLSHSHLHIASDLAWDAAPIVGENIPLLLYAQGKIKLERCAKELENLSCASQFVRKNTDGTIKEIDLPRLYESSINLLRSYITRRLAAQATRFDALFPFFQYEPRGHDQVSKLKADVLSQRIEMMTDQYAYRHLQVQIIRDMFKYARCVLFPACSWDRQMQWIPEKPADGFQGTTAEGRIPVKPVVIREGVEFVRPHPTRIFWDIAHPLASINTDTGVKYVGFWDLLSYRDIMSEPAYFNRDKIKISDTGKSTYTSWPLYFDSQYSPCQIKFSGCGTLRPPLAEGADNDIQAMRPYYAETEADETLFNTQYFEKIIPREMNLGDYPYPVWIRLVVAADKTIIYGEFLPSIPGVYFGLNEDDSRYANLAPAHEIMPFQDQVSNLLSQMLLTAKADALQVIAADIDSLTPEVLTALRDTMKGDKYYVHPILLEYSGIKSRAVGQNANNPISIVQKGKQEAMSGYLSAIGNLMAIMERMLVLSPQELGQSAPSGITAAEVNAITATTTTVYGFIANAIDEGRAAWKKLLYESLVACSTSDVSCPIEFDYPNSVVEAAGLDVAPAYEGAPTTDGAPRNIVGSGEVLTGEYQFTSKDGLQRTQNSLTANTLVQLVSNVIQVPGLMDALGKSKVYEIFNEIFRQSGVGINLNLEVKPGEPDTFGAPPDQVEQAIQQLGQGLQTLSQDSQQTKQTISEIIALINQSTGAMLPAPGAGPMPVGG